MKRYSKIIFSALALPVIALTGCNDFLDTTPTSSISDKLVWTSTDYVDLYVNNFYAYLDRYGQFTYEDFNGNLTEGLTETLKYGSMSPGSRAGDCNDYSYYPERISPHSNLLDTWPKTYERIRRINEFLVSQKRHSTFSEDVNLRYEAQARFFRAFCYFQLAKRHGGVIIYTDMDLVKDKPRSTEAETWALIAEDLDFAAAHLPVKWDAANEGRVTKYAAFAFKSRAMLYAKRWQDAKDAADSVINSNLYALTPEYKDAFKGGNSESILEFRYDKNNPSHSFDKSYVPYGDYLACGADEQGGCATPTQEMVESYETKDGKIVDWSRWHSGATTEVPPYDQLEPRFAATIIYPGATWKGKTMIPTETGTCGRFMAYRTESYAKGRTTTGYYLRKLLNEEMLDILTYGSSQTWVAIRLAEVYLNRAEANYMLGDNGGALKDINTVRTRPGVGLPEKSGLSGDELFDAIRHERKIELAYEGHLYWDMRRWRLAHIEYNNYRVHGLKVSGTEGNLTYEYVECDNEDRKFLEKTYVLPVPDSETLNNSAIEQYDEWK